MKLSHSPARLLSHPEDRMSSTSLISRRAALGRLAAIGFAAPFVFRKHAHASPVETVYHASFGANGMALSDIGSLTASPKI